MAEIRDLGGLLQRAGFALPVADSVIHTVTYANALHLMRDLRAMGEGNAMAARSRHFYPARGFRRGCPALCQGNIPMATACAQRSRSSC